MDVLGVDNVVIDVPDLEAARKFYGEVLGLVEKYFFPQPGVVGYLIGSEEPGLVIRFKDDQRAAQHRGPRIWLEVADARAAAADLAGHGQHLLGAIMTIRTGLAVEVADPFGNVIGLVDYSSSPELSRLNSPDEDGDTRA